MSAPSLEDLTRDLERATREPDRPLQILKVGAVLSCALEPLGLSPILVGGAAVEFYTEGGYQTSDFDFVVSHDPRIEGVMEALGFHKQGHNYVHRKLGLWVEFPGSQLEPEEEYQLLETPVGPVRVLSAEDTLLDRVRAFLYWSSLLDGRNSLLLLEVCSDLDLSKLARRTSNEPRVAACVDRLRRLLIETRDNPETLEGLEDLLRGILKEV